MRFLWYCFIIASVLFAGCSRDDASSPSVVQKVIGPSGGSLRIGRLEVTIAAGALATNTTITIRELGQPAPLHHSLLSPVYSIEPTALVLALPFMARYEFADSLPLREPSFFRTGQLDQEIARIDTQLQDNAAYAKALQFSTLFVGTDDVCQNRGLGWSCEDAQHLVACDVHQEVQSRVTCNCNGEDGDAKCANVDWMGAPWPVGTCLTLVQGYDGWTEGDADSHLHLLDQRGNFAADFQDPHDCDAPVFATCAFTQCRVTPGCRSAESPAESTRWGVDVCIEALDDQANPTGAWQFLSQLQNIDPQIQTGRLLLRGEPIGLMGSSGLKGPANTCDGKRFHLEQGSASPVGAVSYALPFDFLATQNAVGTKVCSAPLAPGTAERTAILELPTPGSKWHGPITIRGRAQDSTGLDMVELLMVAKNLQKSITLCRGDCGMKYPFEATLNLTSFESWSASKVSLGLRVRGGDGGTSMFPMVDIDWEVDDSRRCKLGLAGPPMVRIPVPSAPEGTMCIDQTEVRNEDYAKFLSAINNGAMIDVTDAVVDCTQNSTYVPPGQWPPTNMNHPVVFVDWCDAYAYCKWAGKRLCGRIGGGSVALPKATDATVDQWMNACSAGGRFDFPYGEQKRQAYCHITDQTCGTVCATFDVGTKSLCQAEPPYDGVFDLIGNVSEWEDACSSFEACNVRGSHSDSEDACGVIHTASWSVAANYLGFRCCGP